MILVKSFIRRHTRTIPSGFLCFLFSALLVLLSCIAISSLDTYTYQIRLIQEANLMNLATCSLSPFVEPDEEELRETKAALSELPSVSSCDCPTMLQAVDKNTGQELYIEQYPESLSSVRYPLVAGKWPDVHAVNQILLPNSFLSKYKENDQITLEVLIQSAGELQWQSLVFTVTGFLEKDANLLTFLTYSNQDNLTNLFSTQLSRGIVYELEDQKGQTIQSEYVGNYFILQTNENYDKERIREGIASVIGSADQVHIMPDMIEGYHRSKQLDLQKTIGYVVISFLLSITTLFASTLLSVWAGQKRMSIFYLCGATWAKSIRLEILPRIPYLLLGYCIGLIIYVNYNPLEYFLKWQYIVISFLLILINIGISVLPFYLMTRNRSPLELYRKD